MFSKVKNKKLRYSNFDLSHTFKFTCDMGKLIPVCVREVLPGDIINFGNQALIDLTAQVNQVMHQVDVYFRSFYVPNRLVWKNWDEFITGGKTGNSSVVKPYINVTNAALSSIYDYYGIRTGLENPLKIDAMPFRAYNLICNYYFRDQALQDDLPISLEDGEDLTEFSLQNVLWRKGYFTSARASAQAGSGAVLPLGSSAPVNIMSDGKAPVWSNGTNNMTLKTNSDGDIHPVWDGSTSRDIGEYSDNTFAPNITRTVGFADSRTGLKGTADLSNATASSIETVRNAFKVQSYLEKLNRTGFHMVDWLRSFFGVKASDARLQMPEYCGGFKQSLFFDKLFQTSETSTTPLGTQAGRSSTFANGNKLFKKFIEEHGWFLTLMYIRPLDDYCQGIEKQFTRETKFDYYLPEFANLGEQAILNKEIYAQGTDDDNRVFGYQTRFQEYRTVENRVAGYFKDENSFKSATLVREFGNLPVLNEEFLKCNPSKRIFATEGYDNHIKVNCANYLYFKRKMPKYVIPATL